MKLEAREAGRNFPFLEVFGAVSVWREFSEYITLDVLRETKMLLGLFVFFFSVLLGLWKGEVNLPTTETKYCGSENLSNSGVVFSGTPAYLVPKSLALNWFHGIGGPEGGGEGLEYKTKSQALCAAEKTTSQYGTVGLLTYLIVNSEYNGGKKNSSKEFLTISLNTFGA